MKLATGGMGKERGGEEGMSEGKYKYVGTITDGVCVEVKDPHYVRQR